MRRTTPFPTAVLVLLAACSLGDDIPPEPLHAFQLLGQPKFLCDVAESSLDCAWEMDGELTEKVFVERYPTAEPYVDLVIGDSAQVLNLGWVQENEVPLVVGKSYRFEANLIPTPTIGFPALRISDDGDLVFFAATMPSFGAEDSVLLAPEGWSFTAIPASFDPRKDVCNTQTEPFVLQVEYRGDRIRLLQGETAKLGLYTITCRVARRVDYTNTNCLDLMLPELSFIIYR